MFGVGAGVEDGDLGALAVVAGGPGLGGVDLLRRLLQGGLDLAVEPELLQAGAGAGGRGADLGPEGGGLLLLRLQRDPVDGLEDLAAPGAAGGRGDGGREVGAVDRDQGQRGGGGVVVALADQAGDVEEFLVDPPGGERGGGVLGVDVQVLAGAAGLDQRDGPVLARQGRGRRIAFGVAGDQDAVAGDQGHRGGPGSVTGAGRGLAADQRSLAGRVVLRLIGHGRRDRGDGQDDGGRRPQGRTRNRAHRSPHLNPEKGHKTPFAGGCWCCGGATLAEVRAVQG
ncbi:hypothetical protein STANM309S_03380 [Streptomyces tanashiensis]